MIKRIPILPELIGLFYPRLCLSCRTVLTAQGIDICLDCQLELPRTDQHLYRDNQFTQRFWGRLPLNAGCAMYHFGKGGRVQQMIHRLKYEQRREIGRILGYLYAEDLRRAPWLERIDYIVPVPLHPRKERLRGYNQATCFASGLAEGLAVRMVPHLLRRLQYSDSQTRMGRMERLENVMEAFVLRSKKPEIYSGKHLLLVDDVLTTGATLEACGLQLLQLPDITLSMATIAMARQ